MSGHASGTGDWRPPLLEIPGYSMSGRARRGCGSALLHSAARCDKQQNLLDLIEHWTLDVPPQVAGATYG
jgi:hypothetical protein